MLAALGIGRVDKREGVFLSGSLEGDWVITAIQSSEETEQGEGLRDKEPDGEETGRGEPSGHCSSLIYLNKLSDQVTEEGHSLHQYYVLTEITTVVMHYINFVIWHRNISQR